MCCTAFMCRGIDFAQTLAYCYHRLDIDNSTHLTIDATDPTSCCLVNKLMRYILKRKQYVCTYIIHLELISMCVLGGHMCVGYKG